MNCVNYVKKTVCMVLMLAFVLGSLSERQPPALLVE